jgi:hypothetical protein
MTNANRIAKYISKTGGKGLLVHTIPGRGTWLMCTKIDEDYWSITMGEPTDNVFYNLGVISADQHLSLWNELTNLEINNKVSLLKQAKETKRHIRNFIKSRKTYKKFIKRNKKK